MFRCACANCHSLAAFKASDLNQLGYILEQSLLSTGVTAAAAPRKLSDYFVLSFPSPTEARRLNSGVVPPDLSFVLKQKSSRQVRRILTGYRRN